MKKYGEKDKEQLRHLGRKIDLKKKSHGDLCIVSNRAHTDTISLDAIVSIYRRFDSHEMG